MYHQRLAEHFTVNQVRSGSLRRHCVYPESAWAVGGSALVVLVNQLLKTRHSAIEQRLLGHPRILAHVRVARGLLVRGQHERAMRIAKRTLQAGIGSVASSKQSPQPQQRPNALLRASSDTLAASCGLARVQVASMVASEKYRRPARLLIRRGSRHTFLCPAWIEHAW